jgi:hypothetical protein
MPSFFLSVLRESKPADHPAPDVHVAAPCPYRVAMEQINASFDAVFDKLDRIERKIDMLWNSKQ